MTPIYTAHATATGEGRNGHVRSSDGFVDTDVAIPKEMGGKGGHTNPEQLFAAGYSACFHSALQFVARKDRIDLGASTVDAEVGIGANESGGFSLEVKLHVTLPTLEGEQALALVEAAHQVCPYSNATRGNIPVELSVN
jgi:Ohr subfamily peroxiredoxin